MSPDIVFTKLISFTFLLFSKLIRPPWERGKKIALKKLARQWKHVKMWSSSPRCNPSWQYPSSPGQSGRSPGKEWSPALLPVWEKNYIRRESRLPVVLRLTTGRGCWCAFVAAHFCRWSLKELMKKAKNKTLFDCVDSPGLSVAGVSSELV